MEKGGFSILWSFLVIVLVSAFTNVSAGDVVYAVNAGGEHHIDLNGIHYLADPVNVGMGSDFGKRFRIRRAAPQDQILYQTERWNDASFSYKIPVKEDGEYVLVMKFSEVYFNSPEEKVFNVRLNNRHVVVKDLDIYEKVGHATAHDEIIPLTFRKGNLMVNGETSPLSDSLDLEFLKGQADNPKICAFYLMKGKPEDVPKLPPVNELEDNEEVDDEGDEPTKSEPTRNDRSKRDKLKSGPPAVNPYAEDSSSYVLPIIVAFCLFIPTLVCLCRL